MRPKKKSALNVAPDLSEATSLTFPTGLFSQVRGLKVRHRVHFLQALRPRRSQRGFLLGHFAARHVDYSNFMQTTDSQSDSLTGWVVVSPFNYAEAQHHNRLIRSQTNSPDDFNPQPRVKARLPSGGWRAMTF